MYRLFLTGLPRFALFLLASLPVLIGVAILISMQHGQIDALSDADDLARRASYPFAVVGHILGGSLMLLLGLAQFSIWFRRKYPAWHRWTGRGLVAGGGYFALSGLWMNAAVQARADSWLHDAAQNVVAVAMLAVLVLGMHAIWRRDIAAHRAWMMRAYAIGLGAGTQAVILGAWMLAVGLPGEGLRAGLMGLAWAINLAVAEWVIGGTRRRVMQAMG